MRGMSRWRLAMGRIEAARAAARPGARAEAEEDAARVNLTVLCLMALVVGVVTGLGAVVFRDLIGFIHNVMFLGRFTFAYDSSVFTPASPWGPLVILVPVIGAVGVTWLVVKFAPEARGHGVPEVMDAIYYHHGAIRPVVAVVKSLASALAIGSGAAVGREGPIIQIGSALGSTLGQLVRMSVGQRVTLVAAGAGAGIAATFNTPIGGVLFATELMMPEISVNTFLPLALATGTATFIGRLFFGAQPAFVVPADLAAIPNQLSSAFPFLLYAVLGALTGLASALFIRAFYWTESVFDRVPGRYLRHMLGMLVVGAMMWTLMRGAGHYYVEGVGYSTIQAVLNGQVAGGWFLLALFLAKLAATCLSLGSGSSGGIFSPSLFMGAAIGVVFAALIQWVMPGAPVSLAAFAMVGMGAMVGSATGAAMTAVTMIFEMTRDYNIVLPMILAVALSLGVRRVLMREDIYTMKLVARGHPIPRALHANLFLVRSAKDVMATEFLVMDAGTSFDAFMTRSAEATGLQHVVVTREAAIVGTLRVNADLRRAIGVSGSSPTLGQLAQTNFVVVREQDAAFDVIAELWARRASMAVVTGPIGGAVPGNLRGVISKEHVADAVAASIRIYPR